MASRDETLVRSSLRKRLKTASSSSETSARGSLNDLGKQLRLYFKNSGFQSVVQRTLRVHGLVLEMQS